MWWLMAAQHELEMMPVLRAPEPVVVPFSTPIPVPEAPQRIVCPKCGKTGRGIKIHIRNCKG